MSTLKLKYFLNLDYGTCMNNVRMVKKKTERVDMRIPETLKVESIAVANMENRSLSNLVETLLAETVEQKKATDPRRFKDAYLAVLKSQGKTPKKKGELTDLPNFSNDGEITDGNKKEPSVKTGT